MLSRFRKSIVGLVLAGTLALTGCEKSVFSEPVTGRVNWQVVEFEREDLHRDRRYIGGKTLRLAAYRGDLIDRFERGDYEFKFSKAPLVAVNP